MRLIWGLAVLVALAHDAFHPGVQGLQQTPKNTAGLVGSGVLFQCQGVGSWFSVSWIHNDNDVSQNDMVTPAYSGRAVILATPSERIYNLYINSTQQDLGGEYECSESSVNTGVAMFIVLESDPTCRINASESSSGKLDLVEGERLAVVCETRYFSDPSWNPQMEVQAMDGPSETVNNEVIDHGRHVRSTFTVTAMRAIQDRSYIYVVKFPSPPDGVWPPDSEYKGYSREAPEYKFIAITKAMDIKYQVENLRIENEKDVYIPGEKINCAAVGYPSPTVKWVKIEPTQNTTVSIGGELEITEELKGMRTFRCKVKNTIRGVDYMLGKTISFTVISI